MDHMGKLTAFIVLLAIAAGILWFAAGREPGPLIDITAPQAVIGHAGQLSAEIDTPAGKLKSLDVLLEQGSTRVPLFSLEGASPQGAASPLVHQGADRLLLTLPIGKQRIPQLVQGKAQIIVTASRPVLFGYRRVATTATRDVTVDLTPPIVTVVSTEHYINQGGSEMVIYRVSPANVASGVQVGEYEYPGYPAIGAHIPTHDPGLRVAFFALLWNQDPNTPISLYARDDAGNEAHATFDYRVFPKTFRQRRIDISDDFLQKVVPPMLENNPGFKVADPSNLLAAFLRINRDLRREDNVEIAALARDTSPEMLWQGPFEQLADSAVEAQYADQRTYFHDGVMIDHEVHLGYDLASTANAPVYAANRGRVVHAGWLDLYGNCVVIDHGMGVQSLYGHMASIEVKVGQMVTQGTEIGREGHTGLTVGNHVHFGMLVNGHAVTPIDWWSAKWIHDRIERKLEEAGAPAPSAAASRQASR
jgi:murein DD-endopeptidase MepM/ murein hydrolase activator NlpD